MQSAACFGVALQADVSASTGHVRRDRHATRTTGVGNHFRLARMVASVEYLMLKPDRRESRRQLLGLLNRPRADQDRSPVACRVRRQQSPPSARRRSAGLGRPSADVEPAYASATA